MVRALTYLREARDAGWLWRDYPIGDPRRQGILIGLAAQWLALVSNAPDQPSNERLDDLYGDLSRVYDARDDYAANLGESTHRGSTWDITGSQPDRPWQSRPETPERLHCVLDRFGMFVDRSSAAYGYAASSDIAFLVNAKNELIKNFRTERPRLYLLSLSLYRTGTDGDGRGVWDRHTLAAVRRKVAGVSRFNLYAPALGEFETERSVGQFIRALGRHLDQQLGFSVRGAQIHRVVAARRSHQERSGST